MAQVCARAPPAGGKASAPCGVWKIHGPSRPYARQGLWRAHALTQKHAQEAAERLQRTQTS